MKYSRILAIISIFTILNPLLSQNRDSSHSFAYDSISITKEQRYDIKYLLTASSIEVVCEDYDLASLYGVAPDLNHLFDQFRSALPAKTERKLREELDGDFGSFYNIKVYNRGENLSTISILYECDYPYLSPGMLDFVHTLYRITQYYNSFLLTHFTFERKMTSSLGKYYSGLCNGDFEFEEKWDSLQKRNPDENPTIECAQMSLIFAQCIINAQKTGPYFDLQSFIVAMGISASRLTYFLNFVKQDQSVIRTWIDKLIESDNMRNKEDHCPELSQ